MKQMFDKVCIICNSNFQTSVYNKVVCSKKCHNKYRVNWNRDHRPVSPIRYGKCLNCGKEIELKPNRISGFCSKKCRVISRNKSTQRYKIKHSEEIKNRSKIFRKTEKAKEKYHIKYISILEYQRKYRENHKNEIAQYWKIKYKNDLEYKLGISLRGYIRRAVVRKQMRTIEYIDYNMPQLIERIEKQFKPGMTWNNYGQWHIDHIRPLVSFNFFNENGSENVEEIKKAMALNNLQPLWAHDNISKGGKYLPKAEV